MRAALARMVASPPFRAAPQLTAFLTYVVNTALAGRAHEIKGYTIAVEALGRPADFDPVADPIVRVEAGRLRRAIEAYHAAEGRNDPVWIAVPRGAYVPLVTRRVEAQVQVPALSPAPGAALQEAAPDGAGQAAAAEPIAAHVSAAAARPGGRGRMALLGAALALVLAAGGLVLWWPASPPTPTASLAAETTASLSLPVIGVSSIEDDDPAVNAALANFGLSITNALARFDEFVILDSVVRTSAGAGERPVTYRIDFRGQRSPETLSAAARLIHMPSSRVVWASSIDEDMASMLEPRTVRELARRVAVRLAQPYGVIHSDLRNQAAPGTPMACIVRTYDYWSAPTEALHEEARGCLERLLRADPLFHPAHALLAMLHLDEFRIGYNPRDGIALDRARTAAQRAVSLAPESARALQALMAVQTVSGDVDLAIKTGFEAVRRNPFDTDILADLGARLTQAGRAREGRPLLLRAADLNLSRPVWHDFYLYLSAREVGDEAGVRAALASLMAADAPLALLGRAVAASDAGHKHSALDAMRRLSEVSPVFSRSAGDFLDRAFFAPDVRAMLMSALQRGGLAKLQRG